MNLHIRGAVAFVLGRLNIVTGRATKDSRTETVGMALALNRSVHNVRATVTTLGSDLSSSATAWAPVPETSPAARRLAGTVWERSELARLGYAGLHWFGLGLARLGVSANALTYASLALALAGCVAAATGFFVWAAVAMAAAGACDALDGVVARSTGTVSPFGALLDSTVDRVTDTLPLLGVVVFHSHHPFLALAPGLALIGSVVIPYVRARTEALGASLPPLFMRRPERVLLLIVTLLLGGSRVDTGQPALFLLAGTALLAVLNAVGGVWALRAARRALESHSELRAGAARSR